MTDDQQEEAITLTEKIEWIDADGRKLLSVPSTGRVLLVNDTARLVVEALGEGATRSEIVERLAAGYPDVDRDELERDLARCLLDLTREELVDDRRL